MTPTEIERLIAAFRREDAYLDDLSDSLYLAKVRVYEDTLSGLANEFGYDDQDVQLGTAVLQALSDEADTHAESIAETYNAEMEKFVQRLGALGLSYEQAVDEVVNWSHERDEAKAELIGVTEAYGAHADATVAFFADNNIPVQFDFGGHGDPSSRCGVCQALERTSPHELARVVEIGTPHIQCRQNWRPSVDERDLPEFITLGLGEAAGIVGTDSLVHRAGGHEQAVSQIEET